jgi:hypothetical protein
MKAIPVPLLFLFLLLLFFPVFDSNLLSQDAQGSEYYFPQIADGISGNIGYSTSITFSNPFPSTDMKITIKFYNQNGSAWSVDLRSDDRTDLRGIASKKTFTLAMGESVEIYTAGTASLTAGWAVVQSDFPVIVSAVFQVFNEKNQVTSEGGVLPAAWNTEFSFYATVSKEEPAAGTDIDTGMAVINPGSFTANITAQLFNQKGAQVASGQITLGPQCQTAIFVSQVFSSYSFGSMFHGKMRLSSNVNIAVVAIRQTFRGSNTLSTVAVEPESKLNYAVLYDKEPNDLQGNAQAIMTLPVEITGTMVGYQDPTKKGDVDVYSVYLYAGETLYVMMIHDYLQQDCPLFADLILRNSQFQQVAKLNDEYRGLRDPLKYTVTTSGTYYLDIGCLLTLSGQSTCGRTSNYRMHVIAKTN